MVRVLALADTHLGFDLPRHLSSLASRSGERAGVRSRQRSTRPHRGPGFFDCFERALEPALRGAVDVVVHLGDLLYRSKVPASLVSRALEPLLRVADSGTPVVLIPGNHERSSLPYPLLATHACLHVLDRPRTVALDVRGTRLAISGFPCERDDVAAVFAERLEATGWRSAPADVRLLCLHQAIEGSQVGPRGYTFREAPDVVPARLLPASFAAVLAGHVHRHQVLGRALPAPVVIPGSTERTSFAERNEPKGYVTLRLEPGGEGGRIAALSFHPLPARPMAVVELDPRGLDATALGDRIRRATAELPERSVVQLRLSHPPEADALEVVRRASLALLVPPNMILELRLPR
ncbi:MAG: exonuclease SbcCD subunit D [Thermoanaerobaculaceae bacterium]